VQPFVQDGPAQRIVFGAGTINAVGAELDRLDVARAVVLSTRGQAPLAARLTDLLGSRVVAPFYAAVPHTPVGVTEHALGVVRRHDGDGVVSVGGGSTTGLGKAVASRLGIRHLVLPTTYAGSELTPVLGETVAGEKVTRTAPVILPDCVVYDVELTATLPWPVTLTSAANAMAHAVEALYGQAATGETDAWALESITSLVRGLRALRVDLDRLEARAQLLYGAWLAGRCLGAVGMGLHHQLCHVLGGTFDLPHAPTHAVVLPYAMAFNESAAPAVMSRIAAALGAARAPAAVQALVRELGGPTSLAGIGLAETALERAADLAVARPYPNPREVTHAGVFELLRRAHRGDPVEPTAPSPPGEQGPQVGEGQRQRAEDREGTDA